MEPAVTVSLEGELKVHLDSHDIEGEIYLRIQMHDYKRPVTLEMDGLFADKFLLREALDQGLLELLDDGGNELVALSQIEKQSPPAGSLKIPAAAPVKLHSIELGDMAGNLFKPGRKYQLRLSLTGGDSWCYYGDSKETITGDKVTHVCRLPGTVTIMICDQSAPAV